jgi:hypothetical protein
MIILSSSLAALDSALAPYIQQITFPNPDREIIKKIFNFHLDRLDLREKKVESREEILKWVLVASAELGLSFGVLRAIYRDAVEQANREKRSLGVKDMIRAYTAKTGRPDEWDLVTDESLYGDDQTTDESLYGDDQTTGESLDDDGRTAGESAAPALAKHLADLFGPCSAIPSDGRLELAFSPAFYRGVEPQRARTSSTFISNYLRAWPEPGLIKIIDWGWPEGLWAPTEGCVYKVRQGHVEKREQEGELEGSGTALPGPPAPQRMWKEARFTFGPRGLGNDAGLCVGESGKPWRRLV